jgi:hypothetical protein
MISRRTFLRVGAAGLIGSGPSSTVAAEPVWSGPRDVDEFSIHGDEILTVGSSLRAFDAATGQERRAVRLRRPSDVEGPATVASTDSAIVFGWYVWHEDLYILCADPRSLQTVGSGECKSQNVSAMGVFLISFRSSGLMASTYS